MNHPKPKIDAFKPGKFSGFVDTYSLGTVYVVSEYVDAHPFFYDTVLLSMAIQKQYGLLDYDGQTYKVFILNK